MTWVVFVVSSAVIVLAAVKLAEYGDELADRTGVGGFFIGTLLMAGATSLPELLTTINAMRLGAPNLAAGNLYGSSMFNMFMLALLDLIHRQGRVLRLVATTHALTAGLAMVLTAATVFFLLADVDLSLGWIGLDSLVIMVGYVAGVRLIQGGHGPAAIAGVNSRPKIDLRTVWRPLLGFAVATGVLVIGTPWMVRSSAEIAEITGLGTGFIGTALLAVVTSLPEVVASIAALRIGAFDLAVGNLFGSNVFNMFALGLADVFYAQGPLLAQLDPAFALTGLLALILTGLGLVGNLARLERRILFIEIDAALII
ncbi:MAG: sodium:calcium antiporter, partial [Anaerolineae bacterium]